MKLAVRFSIAFIAVSFTGWAQLTGHSERQAQIESEIHQDISHSVVFIHQQGNENQIMLTQAGINAITIQQSGHFNTVNLTQHMAGGYFQITQDGSNNMYKGNATGEEIELSIIQQGYSNSIQQLVAGRSVAIAITQQGNHNELQQTSDANSMDLKILQRGSDMRLIIR